MSKFKAVKILDEKLFCLENVWNEVKPGTRDYWYTKEQACVIKRAGWKNYKFDKNLWYKYCEHSQEYLNDFHNFKKTIDIWVENKDGKYIELEPLNDEEQYYGNKKTKEREVKEKIFKEKIAKELLRKEKEEKARVRAALDKSKEEHKDGEPWVLRRFP